MTQVSQPAITCSKLTIETIEQGVKHVQSLTPCASVSIVNFEQVIAGWVQVTTSGFPQIKSL